MMRRFAQVEIEPPIRMVNVILIAGEAFY